ncbi:MAG: polynucleotide adenylyltransferase PcnB [Gammaproteobacteria bacterium]
MAPNSASQGAVNARRIPRDEHPISRKDVSPSALKVLYRLGDAGFQAFLVGGGVRDLLLGNHPKDFDIATDATPEEIRSLFRNSRIIGRRFKIVHIRFGREIIEVTTFRAPHDPNLEPAEDLSKQEFQRLSSAQSKSGMLLRDNVYGNIEEDAIRRDFTINSLYYTVNGFELWDFCGGLEDLSARKIRVIGDPEERFKEDPVRMLRAIRFAAKLDFKIARETSKPIDKLSHLLQSVSGARLFDETLKMFSSGYGERTYSLLRQFDLGDYLIPLTLEAIEEGDQAAARLVELALRNTDERIRDDKSVTPAFLFAALLWPALRLRMGRQDFATHNISDIQTMANDVLREQLDFTAIPKRFSFAAREIWELQVRLQRKNRRSIQAAIRHPRFRAAYDFLLLREESGENLDNMGQWWTEFQFSDTNQQATQLDEISPSQQPRRRRRRRKKSASPSKN